RAPGASLWGPPGSGRRSAIEAIARAARLAGFVPVAAPLVASVFAPLWLGRSVLLIASGSAAPPWSDLLRTMLHTPQPHVLLIVADTECRGVEGVPLPAIPSDTLVAALRPHVAGGSLEAVARRAADHSRGLPGRFTRPVWRLPTCGAGRRAWWGAGRRGRRPPPRAPPGARRWRPSSGRCMAKPIGRSPRRLPRVTQAAAGLPLASSLRFAAGWKRERRCSRR